MNRRSLLSLALLSPLVTAFGAHAATSGFQPTAQDRADLKRIQDYLDGLRSMKARFLQIAPNGAISRGTAWLERPGRMRFEYDPPSPYLLVAGPWAAGVPRLQPGADLNIPLSRTPLGILLANHVKLSGDVTVTGMQHLPGQIQVTLVRTDSPGEGSLTLVFSDNPLALRQWTVVDAQRQATRVTLYDVKRGGKFRSGLFEFTTPTQTPVGGNG